MRNGTPHKGRKAFTLVELLVVIAIIGILAVVGLPALKGLNATTDISAANRQLMDDLSYARFKAITERTTVYVVFISPEIMRKPWSGPQLDEVKKLQEGQYSSYAMFTRRSLGDQPGPGTPKYLTDWKHL